MLPVTLGKSLKDERLLHKHKMAKREGEKGKKVKARGEVGMDFNNPERDCGDLSGVAVFRYFGENPPPFQPWKGCGFL